MKTLDAQVLAILDEIEQEQPGAYTDDEKAVIVAMRFKNKANAEMASLLAQVRTNPDQFAQICERMRDAAQAVVDAKIALALAIDKCERR